MRPQPQRGRKTGTYSWNPPLAFELARDERMRHRADMPPQPMREIGTRLPERIPTTSA
jgi:hypothetical protein